MKIKKNTYTYYKLEYTLKLYGSAPKITIRSIHFMVIQHSNFHDVWDTKKNIENMRIANDKRKWHQTISQQNQISFSENSFSKIFLL